MNHKPQVEKGSGLTKVATETGINGVFRRPMENVMKALQVSVIAGVLSGLLLLYDHNEGGLALAASCDETSGQASCSSEVYSTQTSSPACMEPQKGHEPELQHLIFPVVLVSCFIIKWFDDKMHSEEKSVLKLQFLKVGLLGTSLQSDLKRIAATSTTKGLSYVLQEATLALLRHRDYCIYGYSSVDLKTKPGEGQKRFNHLSIKERAKINKETLVNVNDTRNISTSQSSNNAYIVVTILVYAWYHRWKLPPVTSSEQLKEALQNLASIPSDYIINVEVLWNPQHENDFLTEEELLKDYPLMHSV
ncbi:hypothetical protein M8C21_027539 [Ambrosia artemisiifolia]|uniref:Uncharacterized protein n=1 Tax=Ambrosia artemisiifolia TaxID=4212 RepID=A0AAD5CD96_AMBAR|nr:hypothetical protein M8C21_027539 [Ambrosia artemisiifolia]